tara:strand:- start:3225 stop:3629 length:405 start_codon:yes stop_codon:yes gene_type:complete
MTKNKKRILVDMSATLIHHGHIRLLKKASEYGIVIIALTTDEEIKKNKGYSPELSYSEREEILLSIKYVYQVIPSTWLIDEEFLDINNIDLLVHGSDNSNPISKDRLLILPRTPNISSTKLRERAKEIINTKNI